MKLNEGPLDRAIRVVLAAVLLYLAFAGIVTGVLAWIVGIVGVALLVTGVLGVCGVYMALGINTCRTQKVQS